MSVLAEPATSSGSPVHGAMPGGPGRLRRHRTTALLVAAFVVAVVGVLLTQGQARSGADLDPANPDPAGAQALARVLADQGVEVDVVRDAADFDAARVDGDTTVVVTSPDDLGQSTIRRLYAHLGQGDLVVVGPSVAVTRALGLDVDPARVAVTDGRDADCADPRFSGLRLEVDQADAYRGPGCFAGTGGVLVTQAPGGGGRIVDPGMADTELFGAPQALTNSDILRGDDAAIALRLLGQRPHLVWYVPDAGDLTAGEGVSVSSLLPRWLGPGLLLVLFASVLLVVWRGRRLGPLAREPLPVVVKAIETTRSRGRLYRRAGDRGHAASALRRAAGVRLARALRLAPTTPLDLLVAEVARSTGRSVAEVGDLLAAGSTPTSDRDLISLARELDELDREVRRP